MAPIGTIPIGKEMRAVEESEAKRQKKVAFNLIEVHDDAVDEDSIEEMGPIQIIFDNGEEVVFPGFIHQFHPDGEDALKGHLEGYYATLDVNTIDMTILARSFEEETGQIQSVEKTKELLKYVIDKFPEGTFYFDQSEYESARKANMPSLPHPHENLELSKVVSVSSEKQAFHLFSFSSELSNPLCSLSMRIQGLLLFFIDAASIIDHNDPRWKITLLFKSDEESPLRSPNPSHSHSCTLVAYATEYNFFYFPDKTRRRISQFWVLPPHEGQGIGSLLYNKMMEISREDPQVVQVTVEDPSDEFSNLRLANDYRFYSKNSPASSAESMKITMIEFNEIILLDRLARLYHEQKHTRPAVEASDEFVIFRKDVKRNLMKKYPDLMPKDNQEQKISVLAELFEVEYKRYLDILHVPS